MFDLEKGSTLYIDLAKSNSRSKRPRTGIFPFFIFHCNLPFQLIMFLDWFVIKLHMFAGHYK